MGGCRRGEGLVSVRRWVCERVSGRVGEGGGVSECTEVGV